MKRILLINPNLSDAVTRILGGEAQRIAGARARIHALSPGFGSASIECEAELAIAAHGVIDTIAAHPDFDAAIIGAFGDPGYDAAREFAPMPVFGLGRSGLRAAGAGGRRVVIVTLGARLRASIERMAAGAGATLVGLHFLDVSVLALAHDRAAIEDAAVDVANACIARDGAEAVLFGGAPFAGLSEKLGPRIGAPVFDGLSAAVEQACAADGLPARIGEPIMKERRGVSPDLALRIDAFLGAANKEVAARGED
jgi:allantoin racemase